MKAKKISKKRFGLAGAALLLSLTVNSSVPDYNPNWYIINAGKIPKEINKTAEGIEKWVWESDNIRYKESAGRCPFPQETLEKRAGDCKQKGTLALAFYYLLCGKKGRLIIGEVKTKNFKKQNETKESVYHVEVDYSGKTFFDDWFIPLKTYEFDEVAYFPFFYEEKVGVAEVK